MLELMPAPVADNADNSFCGMEGHDGCERVEDQT